MPYAATVLRAAAMEHMAEEEEKKKQQATVTPQSEQMEKEIVGNGGEERPPTPWSIPWILMDLATSSSTDANQSKPQETKEGTNNDSSAEIIEEMDGACFIEEEEEKQPPPRTISIPLLDYLCAFMQCSLKELQVLLQTLEPRRRIVAHLRGCELRTSHLHPTERNVQLHGHDLSAQNANLAYACGGYLDITVRQYYYVKHGRKLKHPYMPCLIEFGGGEHASYYPLEVVSVQLTKPTTNKTTQTNTTLLGRCHRCVEKTVT